MTLSGRVTALSDRVAAEFRSVKATVAGKADANHTHPGSSSGPESTVGLMPYDVRGVAVVGDGEFNPAAYMTGYTYEGAPALRAIGARGHKVVRLPVRWERLQPVRNAALDTTEVARVKTVLANASAAGMRVILDLHNYARYKVNGTELVLGTPELPAADLVDFWGRMSVAFRTAPGLGAYGLMNEPHDTVGAAGAYAGTVRYDFNDGLQGWIGNSPASVSAVSGKLRLTRTFNGAGQNMRSDDAGTKRGSATGGTLSAEMTLSPTAPSVRFNALVQYQNASYQYVPPDSVTYTRLDTGATTTGLIPGVAVRVDATYNAGISSFNAFAIQVASDETVNATVYVDVDNISQGTVTGALTAAQAWERTTQDLVTTIRAAGDGTLLLVAGYGYSGAQVWTTNHPAPWIRDPADNFAYEAHYYFDGNNSGVYANTYATENTNASGGLTARVTREFSVFTDWIRTYKVRGFLGEFGWPNTGDTAGWNAAGTAVLNLADTARLGFSYWAAGAWWGETYILSLYTGDTQATIKSQAAVVEPRLRLPAAPSGSGPRLTRVGGRLLRDGIPVRLTGPNAYWLALNDNVYEGGAPTYPSRATVNATLDAAVAMGANTVRVHTIGISLGKPRTIMPALDVYDPVAFERADYVIAAAKARGLFLSVPLTDRWDYYHGGAQSLVNMVMPSGSQQLYRFWSEQTVRDAFDRYVTKLLNHVNPYTGLRWGDDPTLAMWEVANEFYDLRNEASSLARHASAAALIKQLAPAALVVDGTGASGGRTSAAPGLSDPNVDIVTSHYYNDHAMDTSWLPGDAASAASASKVFMVGEYDWTDGGNGQNDQNTSVTRAQWLAAIENDTNIAGDYYWTLLVPQAGVHNDFYQLYVPAQTAQQAAGFDALTGHAKMMNPSRPFLAPTDSPVFTGTAAMPVLRLPNQASTPTPPDGTLEVYSKADARLYFEGPAGVEMQVVAETDTKRLPEYLTTMPPAPASGVTLFSKLRARTMAAMIGPQGHDVLLQPHLATNKTCRWTCTHGSTTVTADGLSIGIVSNGGSTPTVGTFATTSALAAAARVRLTSTATAGTAGSIRGTVAPFFLTPTAGMGGFNLITRFGFAVVPSTGTRAFVGLHSSTGGMNATVNPTALTNLVGVGWDSTDTPRPYLITNDGSGTATKTALPEFTGVTAGEVYELTLYAPPGSTVVRWALRAVMANVVAQGVITTDVPASATGLTPHVFISNGSLASAQVIDLLGVYVETDN